MLNLAILTGDHVAIPKNQLVLIVSPEGAESETISVVPIGIPRAVVHSVKGEAITRVDSFTLIPIAREKFAAEVFRMVQHTAFQKGVAWIAKHKEEEAGALGKGLYAAFKHLIPPDVQEMIDLMGQG